MRLSLRALAAEEEGGGASGLVSLRICAETDDLAGRGGRAPFEGEEAAADKTLTLTLAPALGLALTPTLTLTLTLTLSRRLRRRRCSAG